MTWKLAAVEKGEMMVRLVMNKIQESSIQLEALALTSFTNKFHLGFQR